jgi:hypothetical protein
MKNILKALIFSAIILSAFTSNAQFELAPDSVKTINELEYGYTITNIQTKEDYERYELKFFVTNTGCTKYIFLKTTNFGFKAQNVLCEFNVINATGKRLTGKGRIISMPEWNYTITEAIKEYAGKTIRIGYTFPKGSTVSGTEIILTPKGEKPIVKMTATNIPEI